jgi:hypothetical protein
LQIENKLLLIVPPVSVKVRQINILSKRFFSLYLVFIWRSVLRNGRGTMSQINDICREYFDNDLIVIPLKDKIPVLPDWQKMATYVDPEKLIVNGLYRKGFGLLLGKPTGIIVADIDTTNKELIEKIEAILPPSPVMKTGNKQRPPNRFYQWDGESKMQWYDANGSKALELLSTGQQTVLPPTMHPLGYPYAWVGQPLLGFDIADLPKLSTEIYKELSDLLRKNTHPTANQGGAGRNNTLVRFATAKFLDDCKEFNTVVAELLEYDAEYHETPLFSDTAEFRTNNAEMNAIIFTSNVLKTIQERMPVMATSRPQLTIVENPILDVDAYKRVKLPRFRGVAQELFQEVYSGSAVPRTRFSAASVLTILSTALGNKCKFMGMAPNLYSMVIAPSGFGKDYPLEYPAQLFSQAGHDGLLNSDPASDSAVMDAFPTNRVQLFTIKEASALFKTLRGGSSTPYTARIGDVLADLFTSANKTFHGKRRMKDSDNGKNKILGKCWSPYCVLLTSMTLESFKASVDGSTISQGLGGRFLYFIDDENKPPKSLLQVRTNNERVAPYYIDFISALRGQTITLDANTPFNIPEIPIGKKSLVNLDDISQKWYKERLKAATDQTAAPLMARKFEMLLKLIQIDVCATSYPKPIDQWVVEQSNIDWGVEFLDAQIDDMSNLLERNVFNSMEQKTLQAFEEIIRASGASGIKRSSLFQKTRKVDLQRIPRDAIIKTLLEANVIFLTDSNFSSKGGPKPKVYVHKNFIKS